MENKYSLLNYDMENRKPTPEFEKATKFLDETLKEMVDGIKSQHTEVDNESVGYAFYGNLHWGSIGEKRKTGDSRVDALIADAIQKINYFVKTEDHGGIGDTATDEDIAYEVDRLMNATPVMHGTLLNRA
jgi:hypothetical protein